MVINIFEFLENGLYCNTGSLFSHFCLFYLDIMLLLGFPPLFDQKWRENVYYMLSDAKSNK